MTVQDTSREAYDSLGPSLGYRQREVLAAIEQVGIACNQEIAEWLGRPINTITGRTRELVDMGLVVEAGRAKYGPTGRRVIYWRAV